MKSVLLSPEGPFSEVPRSDTLFGAICWGIRLTRGEESLEDVLARFKAGDPPFLISSAFPMLDREGLLLPKPQLPRLRAGYGAMTDERLDALRAWKRIEYVPLPVFSTIVTGTFPDGELLDGFDDADDNSDDADSNDNDLITIRDRQYVRNRQFLLPEGSDCERPYRKTKRTRNAVNRLTGATDGSLFHRDGVFFPECGGLHVCVEGDLDIVMDGLSVLQDHGIGGDRSVGRGQFRLAGTEEIDLPAPDGDLFCSLSLCIPRAGEMDQFLTEGYYEIEPRKGVVENSLTSPENIWKKRVLALAEGAILPRDGKQEDSAREIEADADKTRGCVPKERGFHGHNPIVADHFEHGVQHYGYSLPVGIRRDVVDGHGDRK